MIRKRKVTTKKKNASWIKQKKVTIPGSIAKFKKVETDIDK
ncbi:hypothetical protein P4K82_24560 [Bacillus cereus]|nr:hypothetical protein [Bacillus cereus]